MMRLKPLPTSEYVGRIARLQEELKKEGLDVWVGYSSECESAITRYLAGFWPFFDFAGIVVPAEGKAVLVTGGPESLEFARIFSRIPEICVNPLFVESSPPEWIPEVSGESFATIISRVCDRVPKRVGLANWNIFPHVLLEDLKAAVPKAEFVPADGALLRVRMIKSDAEIPYIIESYRITEEAMKAALASAKSGMREWELEAIARSTMVKMGAEATSYPVWVCSGPNTTLSLCRSTDKPIQDKELVQFSFGAKYMGYCGNMCRAFSIGEPPAGARKLMEVGLEALNYTLGAIKPGVRGGDVFDGYYKILAKHGFEKFTLYGPAHGTGTSEVEGLWLAREADFVIQPNMLFNADIWLSDGEHGLRYEDGILVTNTGIKELTGYRREIIVL